MYAIWLVILMATRVVPIKQEFIVNLKTASKVRLVNMTNLTRAMKLGFWSKRLGKVGIDRTPNRVRRRGFADMVCARRGLMYLSKC
ncbi:protein of unknown function (plasmid) [Caballeronia sp. S22]